MRTIKTSTGASIAPDGDLLAMIELLHREVTLRQELERSFEDMNKEIANLIGQMTGAELKDYLQQALFVNTITYENQRASAYVARIGGRAGQPKAKTRPPRGQRSSRSSKVTRKVAGKVTRSRASAKPARRRSG